MRQVTRISTRAEYDSALKHILKNCPDWNGHRRVRKRSSIANDATVESITPARSPTRSSPAKFATSSSSEYIEQGLILVRVNILHEL
jgi:hypothetical protein